MRRFFVEEIKAIDGCCAITGPEAKHITRVLRMGRGDRIILMDGKGTRFQAIIKSAGRHEVLVTLERPLPKPPPPPVEITLCQALLKSRTMDYMVEKTSELGVYRLFPFSSERTVISLEKERLANKIRHWKEIAQSAAKQSDRATPAEIGSLSSFGDLVAKWKREEAIKAILWEEEGSRDLKALLRTSLPVRKFIGMVGPEGGFAGKEIEVAREEGFTPVSLGYRVLRAETAAITMVAIVQYEWGDLSLNKS
jgi:16S rRNA (uracil1498-N3)-methyltransferase